MSNEELSALAEKYIYNKGLLDNYEKICKDLNGDIKQGLKENGETSIVTESGTIKMVTVEKYNMDERKLISAIKRHKIPGLIKTKEYVDMEALESFLYHLPEGNDAFVADVNTCQSKTEVVSLRVTKKKGRL